MGMSSFVKECRDAATYCFDWAAANVLRNRADELQTAIEAFKLEQTADTVQVLMGAWTRAHIAYKAVRPSGGSNPTGVRSRVPKSAEKTSAVGC